MFMRIFGTTLLLVGTAPLAYAQEAADANPTGSGAYHSEIIVTGQKTKRTLQETPASVAVVTGETISNQNLLSVYDILERTPNLAVDGNKTTFSIRGIDAFSVSGGGDGALASVYLDGAVMPRTALTAGPLDLYDIAQVEVFRGPQSTVQGRNALAGAVIIRTTDPSYEWSGRFRALMTHKDGQRRVGAAIGGPLVDGQVAFRVAGEIARADGLIHNVTTHRDADRRESETVRAKLLLTPDFLPDLRIVATFMHDRHRRGIFYSEFDAPYDGKDRIATEDVMDDQTVRSDIGTMEIGYDLGGGLSLTSVTNYSDIRFRSVGDPDRGPTPGQTSRVYDPDKTFQQELRLNIDKSWVHGLIGGYYLRDDNRGYQFEATQGLNLTRLGVDRQLLAMGLPQATVNAVLNLYGGVVPIRNSLSQPRLTENYAGFADLTFPVTDRLRVNVGLRYDHETQERGAIQTVVIDRTLPDPANLPVPALAPIITQLNVILRATAAGANSIEPVRPVTYQAWLPKVGLTYDFAQDVSLSFTAQRGYRAGGSGLNQQRAETYDFNPEYTWNYEFALRSEWFNRRLTLNANAYWIDWKDQQVSVQLTPGAVFDTQVVNAGKSRLYGFEVELSGRPTQTLNLYAGAGYSNTRFQEFNVTIGSLSAAAQGNEFARAPHWTVSGGATFHHPNGLFANLNANYRSAYYQDTVDQMFRDIPGRTLVNAKIGWQGEHFGVFLTASNIFDVQKPSQFFTDFDGRVRGTLIEPRILGLNFEGRF
ncbi:MULTISPECIES: TonB-dependent receptor [unclassified Sphingobium]|uniref:TonB-dependent receptor n=1 Tax=unclassified Sphingobium TaxID=2611147 RepID=UPI000D17E6D8|nr:MULTISPECIES: TonB-dependent receptor [unclassified Sphingobium]MBG6116423.1 outer membrane receptor protein involved in Fe transport [Sphingobium sp. JAI105]PSO09752.1 TonB-dependent receptor [Sphingobium sp. AEW4]TWC97732.1 outer membrane receptor protein involved in Fe transport [Sphingobium sp. AEW010]TWD17829.1 outer membrane receptor protein involved in Fe transport [Sphingobium sp. AEW013]TWD20075.1 outer membrane receptor protein involved in Fe transport [Sphingobium sp. AEW001]